MSKNWNYTFPRIKELTLINQLCLKIDSTTSSQAKIGINLSRLHPQEKYWKQAQMIVFTEKKSDKTTSDHHH